MTRFSRFVCVSCILLGLFSQKLCGQISFLNTELTGTQVWSPTSIQFGPDGRLYVGEHYGAIRVITVQESGTNVYEATQTEIINIIQTIPNHDDDGSLNSSCNLCQLRQITGIFVTGSANQPIIYVSSSDLRAAGGPDGSDVGLDTNSGILSKLTYNGSSWDKVDLVRGLPRSEENHSPNGMVIDENTNTLYLTIGGFTNAGAPSNNFAYTPEYALSACILSIDLDAVEALPLQGSAPHQYHYDLPTLDDPDRSNVNGITDPNDPGYDGIDVNDPFGGNDGLNMAKWEPTSPVQVHAGGFRNPYDVIISSHGHMFSIDNGANNSWGGYPINEGDANSVTGEPNEIGYVNNENGLHYIPTNGYYYGGHPNPLRANPNNVGLYTYSNTGVYRTSTNGANPLPANWPPVDPSLAQTIEADFQQAGVDDGSLVTYDESTNGLCEYTASTFGGLMKGDILSVGFEGSIWRAQLADPQNNPGTVTNGKEILFSGVANIPLDIVARGDNDSFPGTIWVADYGAGKILVFTPLENNSCGASYDALLDEDDDGYSNADEIDNNTDPCSPSSKPDDFDKSYIGDFLVSNLNDPDDDDDGIVDEQDAFAWDAQNGLDTEPELMYELFNAQPGTGFFGLGFTGLMSNGSTNYLDQFDSDDPKFIAGGTAGLLTIPTTTGNAASGNQDNGFQFGVNVDSTDCSFIVRVRLKTPIFDVNTGYENYQEVGFFIGTGNQSDYMKITINGPTQVQFIQSINGVLDFSEAAYFIEPLIANANSEYVDLFLDIDPRAGTVSPSFSVAPNGNLISGSAINMSSTLKTHIQNPNQAMAVGIQSSSFGATNPFYPTWDQIEIFSPKAATEALTTIAPSNASIDASSHETGSFSIENNSPDGVQLTKLTLDLGTSILKNLIFDPFGTAGDDIAKGFTADGNAGNVGFVSSNYLSPLGSGYQQLEVLFSDFDPGESFTFSIDVDPLNIQGSAAPGPGNAGNISGLELAKVKVHMIFSDCSEKEAHIFPTENSVSSGQVRLLENPAPAPSLQMQGLNNAAPIVSEADQTLFIQGQASSTVRLILWEAAKFLPTTGILAGIETPNSVIQHREQRVNLDTNGEASIAIKLSNTALEQGYNYLFVIQENETQGGSISNIVEVQLEPCLAYDAQAGGTVSTGGDETEISLCMDGQTNSHISFQVDGAAAGSYAYLITDENSVIYALINGNSHDFAPVPTGAYQVHGYAYLGSQTAQVGDTLSSTTLSDSCFSLSQNFVNVQVNQVDGGEIQFSDGENSPQTSCYDGEGDIFSFIQTNNKGENYAFLLADEQNVLIEVLSSNEKDVESLGPGTYHIWGISYFQALNASPGDTLGTHSLSEHCHQLSNNFLTINKLEINGGILNSNLGHDTVFTCVGENTLIQLDSNQIIGPNYTYVLTNEANQFIEKLPGDELPSGPLQAGTYKIYGLSYSGNLSLQNGQEILETSLSDQCYDLSQNNIILLIDSLHGGTLSTNLGHDSVFTCSGKNTLIQLDSGQVLGPSFSYILTDRENHIIENLSGDVISSGEIHAGTYRIYGLSYSGNLSLQSGQDISESSLSDQCFDLSQNHIALVKDSVLGGTISSDLPGDPLFICKDGQADHMRISLSGNYGTSTTFILTDLDQVILDIFQETEIDIETIEQDSVKLWGLTYSGELSLSEGENLEVATISSRCSALSANFITIIQQSISGGRIQGASGETSYSICLDENPDPITLTAIDHVGEQYAFLLTDEQNILIDTEISHERDLNILVAGNYRLWGISFYGDLSLQIGDTVGITNISPDCFALSENYLTLSSKDKIGGSISTATGSDSLNLCIGDSELTHSFLTEDMDSSKLALIRTDRSNLIIDIVSGTKYDFHQVGEGNYRIWAHASYDNFNLAIGDTLDPNTFQSDCEGISTNFIHIQIARAQAGEIFLQGQILDAEVCFGDGNPDLLNIETHTTSLLPYVWVLTDSAHVILEIMGEPSIDMEAKRAQEYRIFGVSYAGEILLTQGDTLEEQNLSDACFSITDNYISILPAMLDGCTVSIDPPNPGTEFLLFPNPVQDNLNVRYRSHTIPNSQIRIEIFSINGTKVFEKKYTKLNGTDTQISLETSDLVSGTYLLKLSEGNQVAVGKFVKM